METSILGVCANKKGPHSVSIFGHSTKGLPGVEIIGLGKYAKIVKEKFIYITRIRQMRIPMRRIVLCVELDEQQLKGRDFEWEWLELPLILIFWHLTDHLSILGLEDCMAAGKIFINGKIELFPLPSSFIQHTMLTQQEAGSVLKVITLKQSPSEEATLFYLPITGMLERIPGLFFEQKR